MQIVIELNDNEYAELNELKEDHPGALSWSAKRILDGTPLPKGHGDIVDIETLINMFWDGNSMEITKYDLSVIEPIIEADKAESEDKE